MKKKRLLLAVLALLLLAAALWYRGKAGRPEGDSCSCVLSIRCDTALGSSALTPETAALLPDDGAILPDTSVSFVQGESVFDVLLRETRERRIQMEFSETPVYASVYVEGIGNLYEFDGGPASGWMYSVNGVFPNYGCADYKLENGDVIAWRYTCNLGGDIGGHNNYS